MRIDAETVRRIATLAHLELDAATEAAMQRDLGAILEYVEQLNQADTAGVEPMEHVLGGQTPAEACAATLREDEPRPSLEVEAALRNAPRRGNDLFQVPAILDRSNT